MDGRPVNTADGPGVSETVRVLHVDDEPAITELCKAYLERDGTPGTEVRRAHSAGEGCEYLERERFDCVVSDYVMPEASGLEFLEQVRAVDPTLPFVLFTGRGSEEVASRAIAAGVTDYIQKGGAERLKLLENRVRHAVRERRVSRQRSAEAQKFRAVFEHASDAMVLADDDGRFLDANPEACTLFGVERAELLGRTGAEFTPPESDVATAWARVEDADRDSGSVPVCRPDGTRVVVECVASSDVVPGVTLSVLRPLSDVDAPRAASDRDTGAT